MARVVTPTAGVASESEGTDGEARSLMTSRKPSTIASRRGGGAGGGILACCRRCWPTATERLVSAWVDNGFASTNCFEDSMLDAVLEEYAPASNGIEVGALDRLVLDCVDALVEHHARRTLELLLRSRLEDPATYSRRMGEVLQPAGGGRVSKADFKGRLSAALGELLPETEPKPAASKSEVFLSVPERGVATKTELHSLKFESAKSEIRHATSDGQRMQRLQTLKGPLLEAAQALPQTESLSNKEPVFCKQLPGTTIDAVRAAVLKEPWLYQRCMEKAVQGFEFDTSKWQDGTRVQGSRLRGMRYKMPPPKDIPAAVAKLKSIPSVIDASLVLRMCGGPDEVIMLEQTSVPEVPFGENFEVLLTHCFRPFGSNEGGSSGVNYYRYVKVVWVKEPSWTLKWIKGIIEKETMSKASASGDIFVDCIKERLGGK